MRSDLPSFSLAWLTALSVASACGASRSSTSSRDVSPATGGASTGGATPIAGASGTAGGSPIAGGGGHPATCPDADPRLDGQSERCKTASDCLPGGSCVWVYEEYVNCCPMG